MNRSRVSAIAVGIASLALLGLVRLASADEGSGRNFFRAELKGFQEVPANSTTGTGELRARIIGESSIEFELSYKDLEGAVTTAAHVHLGQTSVNGGVSFFFCGGGGRPACTPTSGTFTGTVIASDVVGPTAQGLAAGEFAELLRAMRAGATYANVHTDKHPGGEIRGQLRARGNDDHD
jgi:hypothetical protein